MAWVCRAVRTGVRCQTTDIEKEDPRVFAIGRQIQRCDAAGAFCTFRFGQVEPERFPFWEIAEIDAATWTGCRRENDMLPGVGNRALGAGVECLSAMERCRTR